MLSQWLLFLLWYIFCIYALTVWQCSLWNLELWCHIQVLQIELIPDRKQLWVLLDRCMYVYAYDRGCVVHCLNNPHIGAFTCLVYCREYEILMTGGRDGIIKVAPFAALRCTTGLPWEWSNLQFLCTFWRCPACIMGQGAFVLIVQLLTNYPQIFTRKVMAPCTSQ